MPAYSSVKSSDSQDTGTTTLWSSTVLGGFSALSLKVERDAIIHTSQLLNIHSPGY